MTALRRTPRTATTRTNEEDLPPTPRCDRPIRNRAPVGTALTDPSHPRNRTPLPPPAAAPRLPTRPRRVDRPPCRAVPPPRRSAAGASPTEVRRWRSAAPVSAPRAERSRSTAATRLDRDLLSADRTTSPAHPPPPIAVATESPTDPTLRAMP